MVEQEQTQNTEQATTPATDAASTTTASTQAEQVDAGYSGDLGQIENTFVREPVIEPKPVPLFAYGNRVRIAALHKCYEPYLDRLISVAGWARSTRLGGDGLFFIELNDGSCQSSLQVVVTSQIPEFAQFSTAKVGTSFSATGKLIRSPKQGQPFELQVCSADVHKCKLVGVCPAGEGGYPLPPKKHTNEYLRQKAHMRCRTKLISAVTRVRNNLSYATHKFFQERGFQYIHTPIITASDCEGAGEMFQVTTGMPAADKPVSSMKLIERVGQENEEEKKEGEKPISKAYAKKLAKKAAAKAKAAGQAAPETPAADGEAKPAEAESAPVEEEKKEEAPLIPFEERKFNYRSDFFKKPAFLTVSGQINVETYACGMGDVYTFGPTFRAEHSDTTRHLAEFWMIEPELCFAELSDVMDCSEDYVKYCIRYVMENNADDIEFFNQFIDKGLKDRLTNLIETPFTRLTYTDAIKTIEDHLKDKKIKFKVKPKWGDDLGSEHERYLAEKVYMGPVSVYNYPKSFKAFYMKANDDNKTVQAFDMLVPGIGELIGGSAREENLEKLDAMIVEKGLNIDDYWWYRELRMYGTQPHGGFGLGFERLVMMATGVENIRDVIPFPREYQKAEF